jgi:hypothetical protein
MIRLRLMHKDSVAQEGPLDGLNVAWHGRVGNAPGAVLPVHLAPNGR